MKNNIVSEMVNLIIKLGVSIFVLMLKIKDDNSLKRRMIFVIR